MDNNILEDFRKAWETLDSNLLIKHLSKEFVYDSQWVFASLDYDGYVEYIQRKFEAISLSKNNLDVSIVADPYLGGKMLKIVQNCSVIYYRIKIESGKVIKDDLCAF